MKKIEMVLKVVLFTLKNIGKKKGIACDISGSMYSFKKEQEQFLKLCRRFMPNAAIVTQEGNVYTDHSEVVEKARVNGVDSLLYFTDGIGFEKAGVMKVELFIPKEARY